MRRFFFSLHLYYKTTFYKKKKPFGNLSKEPRRIGSSIYTISQTNYFTREFSILVHRGHREQATSPAIVKNFAFCTKLLPLSMVGLESRLPNFGRLQLEIETRELYFNKF
jgi:hypothetical protein